MVAFFVAAGAAEILRCERNPGPAPALFLYCSTAWRKLALSGKPMLALWLAFVTKLAAEFPTPYSIRGLVMLWLPQEG